MTAPQIQLRRSCPIDTYNQPMPRANPLPTPHHTSCIVDAIAGLAGGRIRLDRIEPMRCDPVDHA